MSLVHLGLQSGQALDPKVPGATIQITEEMIADDFVEELPNFQRASTGYSSLSLTVGKSSNSGVKSGLLESYTTPLSA